MAKCDKVEWDIFTNRVRRMRLNSATGRKREDGKPVPIKRQRFKAKSNFMLIKSLHHK